MKKKKLYTVTKHNRPAFMPGINYFDDGGNARWDLLASQAYGANYGDAGYTLNDYKQSKNILGISKENNPFSKGNIGNIFNSVKPSLGMVGTVLGNMAGNMIGNGYKTNANGTVSGLVSAAQSINTGNPIIDIVKNSVLGIGQGLYSRGWGIKENTENVNYIKDNTNNARQVGQTAVNTSDYSDLLDKFKYITQGSGFSAGDLYKNGWFTNKGTKKGNLLINKENNAIAYQNNAFEDAFAQVDKTNDDKALSTFVYSDGGGIHIDPSKKGTFTAAASKHGMGVQEFASKVLANKEDYSPTMVKKANFAKNAAKWHDYGGPLNYLNTGALGIMQNDKYLDAINHRSDVLAKNAGVQYSSYTPGTYAFGGELGTNGTDWTNGLLYVDEGGTHQQNPLGGVPVGFDQNGTPNLVEEGETIWNDYVFSNRIKVPKAMFHTLGLGGAMKKNKLTFADASKKLAKESEQRPNDPISMAGLEASLSKLAAVQEAERMKKQMRESVGLENMAAYGGPLGNVFAGPGDIPNALSRVMYRRPDDSLYDLVGAAQQQASTQNNSSTRSNTRRNNGLNPYAFDNGRWNEFAWYDPSTGYDKGYLDFVNNINQDWIDAILRGDYGDMSRYLGSNKGYKISADEVKRLATDERYSDMHKAIGNAYAAYINNIDPTTGQKREAPANLGRATVNPTISKGITVPDTVSVPEGGIKTANTSDDKTTTITNPPQDEFKPLPTWMRYASVFGGAANVLGDLLGLTNKPDYTYADKLEAAANAAGYAPNINAQPIGDYIRYNPFDRLFYANQLQANARATDRTLANTSSPSRAAGLLANAYNTTNSLGNLYRQGDEYNLAQRQQTADFNRRTNMFNSQMGLEAAMANARYRQAAKQYQLSGLAQAAALRDDIDKRVGAARSANLTNLFNSIGDIGRENMSFNMVNSTSAANNGYWIDKNGVVHYTNRENV